MHKAIVAKITEVIEIPGADKIQVAKVLGENVIVSKDWPVGFEGILFPVDLQLSEDFCKENNLFRHSHLNKDETKKGFFDGNRRIRAQAMMKVKSEGFFADKSCLSYLGDVSTLKLGDTFDSFNGKKVCEKYYSEQTKAAKGNSTTKAKKKSLVPDFKEHVDTENVKYAINKIGKGDVIYFHSKRHGTSFRSAKTKVYRDKKSVINAAKIAVNQLLRRDIFSIEQEWGWEYVTGSRRVILDAEKVGDGWHGNNAYRFEVTEALKPYLEDSYCAYGEIVGFVNGSPIMGKHNVKDLKDKRYTKKYGDTITYKYGCKEHEYKFHVYRITYTDVNGVVRDMPQKELEKFCKGRDIPCTLEVHPPVVYDGDEAKLRELVDELTERPELLTEDFEDSSMVSEGIILRIENGNNTPIFLKSKSYAFRCLDSGGEHLDMEDAS